MKYKLEEIINWVYGNLFGRLTCLFLGHRVVEISYGEESLLRCWRCPAEIVEEF